MQNLSAPNFWDISSLFTLGVLGTWRWSWWITQVIRSRIYLHWISSQILHQDQPLEDLIRTMARALYATKAQGRDRAAPGFA